MSMRSFGLALCMVLGCAFPVLAVSISPDIKGCIGANSGYNPGADWFVIGNANPEANHMFVAIEKFPISGLAAQSVVILSNTTTSSYSSEGDLNYFIVQHYTFDNSRALCWDDATSSSATETISGAEVATLTTFTWDVTSYVNQDIANGYTHSSFRILLADENKNPLSDDNGQQIVVFDSSPKLTMGVADPVFSPGSTKISYETAVTVTCLTPNVTIYYTTDGSTPTTSSNTVQSGSTVQVSPGSTLKAYAVLNSDTTVTSNVTTATYERASYNRPEKISKGSATVDGDLKDWAEAVWTPLDQPYDTSGSSIAALNTDIPEAYYAAKWQANKVYVAVKVRDTAHFFTDSNTAWNGRDAVEIYLHTDGGSPPNYAYCTTAQQYIVGIKNSDNTKVWACIGGAGTSYPVLEDGSFDSIGKAAAGIDGEWLYYEIEMTPFTYFSYIAQGSLTNTVTTTLELGDVIGLDVCVDGRNATSYTGMKSENMMGGKYGNWANFGVHKLADTITLAESRSGRIDTTSNGSGDLLFHNGSTHINGSAYNKITLSGTVTNWTGIVEDSWAGTWAFVSLLGSDYFVNRNVPAVVNETTTTFAYVGNSNYGSLSHQCGFGENAGMLFWKNGYWKALGQINNAFAAQDCEFGVGGNAHKDDLPWNPLTNSTQFDYEVVYDLDALTMTLKVKDVGDYAWDETSTISIGLRDATGNDDWSDLVTSVQVTNDLPTDTTTYGYNYTLTTTIESVIPGDANFDGAVNVSDLSLLAANYGTTSGATWKMGDFTGDGAVNVSDLSLLAANYGTGSSSMLSWADAYAQAFGTTSDDADESSADAAGDSDETTSSVCSSLGLSLVAGLALMGLMMVKLEE